MGLEQYTQYTLGMALSTNPVDNAVDAKFLIGTPPQAGSLVRIGQSGSLRGMASCNITSVANNNFVAGMSFLHSQSNITAGGSFYVVGFQNPNLDIIKFLSGPVLGTALHKATVSVGTISGNITVYWDANVSGLHGTRITVYLSEVLKFDIFDIFDLRVSSSGEGVFFVGGAGQAATMKCFTFAQSSLS